MTYDEGAAIHQEETFLGALKLTTLRFPGNGYAATLEITIASVRPSCFMSEEWGEMYGR